MSFISFRTLAQNTEVFSKLFLDYIDHYDKVSRFYSGNFKDPNAWQTKIGEVTRRNIDRQAIVRILRNQNRDAHCGIQTLENIDLLLHENTLAVVTGQQVGLFSGPLYTFYKALHTVLLASKLRERFPEYNFVPIFWLEGEDHDYEEVSSFSIIDKNNSLQTFTYKHSAEEPTNNYGAVGTIEFQDSIIGLIDKAFEALPGTEYSKVVAQLFRTAYQPRMTFNRAFIHLMNELLMDAGLIFVDPNSHEVKRILAPIFKRDLTGAPPLCTKVIRQSDELEKNYHAQIKPPPLNVFLFHDGGRYLLEPRGEFFGLKGTRHKFSKAELIDIIEHFPSKLSPNVVLRPLCQDYLLPTIAYVAGPSEVAYFAQLKPLYEEFSISEPIIYPRASITVFEDRAQKACSKFGLEAIDLLGDKDSMRKKVLERISTVNLDATFSEVSTRIRDTYSPVEEALRELDPTLLSVYQKTIQKMEELKVNLKKKAEEAHARRHDIALGQIEKAALSVMPGSLPQERMLNVLYFLNKYGLEFLRWISTEMNIESFRHQIIEI